MKYRYIFLIIVVMVGGGCTKMKIEEFDNTQPLLVLEEYFVGKTKAWGMFEDRFGRIQRQFVVDITGKWEGNTLTLREDFIYSDGETETRIWVLNKTGATTYEGTTDNVIGVAKGTINGNAFNWVYDFNLKVEDSIWKVKFDDWMILQPDGVLLNKATITRWGIKLGTVYISFSKPAEKAAVMRPAETELSLVAS
ncbi:MAG: DUF3833 domain-containing protein [bacterium]